MANQQQLDLLQERVKEWNPWRKQHPGIHPNLRGADLRGADLSGTNLSYANLSYADLRGADLSETNLNEADLSYADLSETYLNHADLSGADLNEARLSNADLSETSLNRTDFSGALLNEARLNGANLSRADLSRADLSRARVGGTIFGNVDLRTVKGLEAIDHEGPSTIGTNTLLRSEGDIPEIFLRKAGLTDTFITYTRSLVQNPIEYYTCFISYSSQDQEFVERLYADLQAKGVRCWYAPEDLKIGDEFRHRIDESIRVYDKLMVILSQHSIESSWVEYEVKKALKKEQDQGKPALFPIALDEAVKDAPDAWAAAIRRKRHIGDFTHWKEHDAYQKGLKRLMRDLQASNILPIRTI